MDDEAASTGGTPPEAGEGERALTDLLARPELWAEGDEAGDVEAAVVAAIAAERAAPSHSGFEPETVLPHPRSAGAVRRWLAPIAVGVAAAVAVLVGSTALRDDASDDGGQLVALSGPGGGSAEAEVIDTPRGTRIVLDVTGLPPAPSGTFYQVALEDGSESVSAGTFHLRGGDGEIELWAGVTLESHPAITVTLEGLDAGLAPDGDLVLRGEVTPTG